MLSRLTYLNNKYIRQCLKPTKNYFSSTLDKNFYWNDLFTPNEKRFSKVLIANRGEIACRIISTCRRLGIQSVAVHSDVDALSPHVQAADQAVCVGPAPAGLSYLNVDAIVEACVQTGAQAVHPGYGFLSESRSLAARLHSAGLSFVGPNVHAISAMGDKLESKRVAQAAGVSCVPGWDGEVADEDSAARISAEIGFPVMMKASAGGGGKGMRVAWNERQVREGFRLCKEEAASSFGDDRMLIEKFIDQPRHIEVQVLCDKFGNAVHLFERECSIQRRNQKVIEEAPSTFLDDATRDKMGQQAVQLARAVGYDSAGTVEFLVDSRRNFYFLEMNTRLQVEHPITECLTGIDIVHQMLRVAAGNPLLFSQDQVLSGSRLGRGWALECRVYAEDPARQFGVPAVGRLSLYAEPRSDQLAAQLRLRGCYVRCDSGVEEGSEISIYYDPMICKLVTFGNSRHEAVQCMRVALDNYLIRGVTHNIPLLRDILEEQRFLDGRLSTNYLNEVYPDGFQGRLIGDRDVKRAVAVSVAAHLKSQHRFYSSAGKSPFKRGSRKESQFVLVDADFHSHHNDQLGSRFLVHSDYIVSHHPGAPNLYRLSVEQPLHSTNTTTIDVPDTFDVNDSLIRCDPANCKEEEEEEGGSSANTFQLLSGRQGVSEDGAALLTVQFSGRVFHMRVFTEAGFRSMQWSRPPVQEALDAVGAVLAPMAGLLKSLAVQVGQKVGAGQELCVLEAMKMQNSLCASRAGVVKTIGVKAGQTVSEGEMLIELE